MEIEEATQAGFIQALIKDESLKDLERLIELLKINKKIQFLNLKNFCLYLKQKIGDYSNEIINLLKISQRKEKQKNIDKPTKFVYPKPIEKDSQFQRSKLKVFVKEYFEQKDNINQTNFIHQQSKKDLFTGKYQLSFKKLNEEENIPFWFESIQQKPAQCQFFQQSVQYGQSTCKNSPILQQSQVLQEQDNEYLTTSQMIPTYFKSKRDAIYSLLAINAKQFFKQQLKQVKDLIRNQICNGKKLVQIYMQFLYDYRWLYLLKQGKCDPKNQYYHEIIKMFVNFSQNLSCKASKIQHIYGINSSSIMKLWQHMYKLLQEKQEISLFKTEEIKQFLLQGLETVYLVYKGEKTIYGLTNNLTIEININHLRNKLSIQQYRNGPLKPYLCLVIYRELSHFLIRKYFKQVQISQNRSFCYKKKTIGNQFISIIKNFYPIIQLKFNFKRKFLQNQYQAHKQIQRLSQIISITYDFILKHKNWMYKFQNLNQDYCKIRNDIEKTQKIYQKIKKQKANINFFVKQKWQSIYIYIEKLQNNMALLKQPNYQKNQQYKLFFSLFMQEKIVLCLNEKFCKQKYNQYRIRLANIQTSNYYLHQDELIEYLSAQLNLQQYNFQFQLQPKNGLLQFINQKVNDFCNNLDLVQTDIFLNDLNRLITVQYPQLFQKQIRNQDVSQELRKASILTKQNKNNYKTIVVIDSQYNYHMLLLKYSEILAIAIQMKINNYLDLIQKLEAVPIMQKKLFPNLSFNNNIIYAKDYKLIQNIQDQKNRNEVGLKPISKIQSVHSIGVERSKRKIMEIEDENYIERGYCGFELDDMEQKERQKRKKK